MSHDLPEAGVTRKVLGLTPLAIAVLASLSVLVATLYGGCVSDLLGGDAQAAASSKVVERFMQSMATGKPNAAQKLFSQYTNPDEVRRGLSSLAEGPNMVLFDGYRSLSLEGYHVGHWQGCITNSHSIDLSGAVLYDDGSRGQFKATLVKENEGWALEGVNVTVPPAKVLRTR